MSQKDESVWYVHSLTKLTNRVVTDYLRQIGGTYADEQACLKECSDGKKRPLTLVPWEVIPKLWSNSDASFHAYSAPDASQKPHHAKIFCCERGKMHKISKGGKIKKTSELPTNYT